jgi:hypothetical protein
MRRMLAFCLAGLLLLPIAALAQTGKPALAGFKLKELKLSGFEWIPSIVDWIVPDGQTSIAFAVDEVEDSHTTLRSFMLSSKGKASSPNELLRVEGGGFGEVKAFWIDNPAPANGYGLLFITYTQWTPKKHLVFAVARFDREGMLLGNFETILDLDFPPGNDYYRSAQFKVGRNNNGFAAVLSYTTATYSSALSGYIASAAFFAQLSLDGVVQDPGLQEIKIPKGGDMVLFQPYTPAWNGVSWMVPAVVTQLVVKTDGTPHYTEELYSQLMALVATPTNPNTPAGPVQMRLRRIARDNTPACVPFEGLQFLPRPVTAAGSGKSHGAAVGGTLYLLYDKAIALPWQQWNEQKIKKIYSYFIQPVNGKGKRAGAAVPFATLDWQRKYSPDPEEWNLSEHADFFSNAVIGENGKLLIAHNRSALFYSREIGRDEYLAEIQLDLYSFDLSGSAPVLVAQNRRYDFAGWPAPLLLPFGGKVCVIQHCFKRLTKGTKETTYFGLF